MKRTVQLYIRVDEDVKDALVEQAAREERTLSQMASILLRKSLKVPKNTIEMR